MTDYELYVADPLGNRLGTLARFERLDWTRVVNDVGTLTLQFGEEQTDWRLFGVDRRVEVWRVLPGGVSRLVRVYFLRYIRRQTDAQGRTTIILQGRDANDLLRRRIIDADAGDSNALKTLHADSLIKAYFDHELGSDASDGRDMTAFGLTREENLDIADTITMDAARRNLLMVCQDVCDAAAAQGQRLYFDIVSPTPATLRLQTFVGRRGADRRRTQRPFSLLAGMLAQAAVERDWTEEANYIYAAGQGGGEAREIVEVYDELALRASPWARCEHLADGRMNSTTEGLSDYGYRALQERKAKVRFEAWLTDAPGSRFQLDWDFGDLVTAEYADEVFDAEVRAVHGIVSAGEETIEARLDYVG